LALLEAGPRGCERLLATLAEHGQQAVKALQRLVA
jgi:hypothetical protein